jgi:hypothetical protein
MWCGGSAEIGIVVGCRSSSPDPRRLRHGVAGWWRGGCQCSSLTAATSSRSVVRFGRGAYGVEPRFGVGVGGQCRGGSGELARDVGVEAGELVILAVGGHGVHQFVDEMPVATGGPTRSPP